MYKVLYIVLIRYNIKKTVLNQDTIRKHWQILNVN